MKRTICALYVGGVVAASVLLPNAVAIAATADIKAINISSPVVQVEVSNPQEIVLQLQDAAAQLAAVDGDELVVKLQSSSATGVFFANKESSKAITTLSITANDTIGIVYYKDATPGEHVITAIIEDARLARIVATYTVKVAASVSAPKVSFSDTAYTYTKQSAAVCTVRGSIVNVPDSVAVQLVVMDVHGKELSSLPIDKSVRGEQRDILEISKLLDLLPAGEYTLKLVVLQEASGASGEIVKTTPIPLTVKEPVVSSNTVPTPVPNKPGKVSTNQVAQPPLEELKPVTNEVMLSTDFSVPYAVKKSVESRRPAAVVARRSGGNGGVAPVKVSSVTQSTPVSTEKTVNMDAVEAVSLALPGKKADTKTATADSHSSALRLFGIEWYWWGGVGALGVVWLGVRRLVK